MGTRVAITPSDIYRCTRIPNFESRGTENYFGNPAWDRYCGFLSRLCFFGDSAYMHVND